VRKVRFEQDGKAHVAFRYGQSRLGWTVTRPFKKRFGLRRLFLVELFELLTLQRMVLEEYLEGTISAD